MSARDNTQPATDEQIEAYTIGTPRELNSTVALDDYDPTWPARFDVQNGVIRRALGPEVLRLEHIGSTSVPGLAAKPILDVMLHVWNTAEEESYVPQLEAAGFRLQVREPEWHEHRVFVKRIDDGDDENVNLHVYTEGCVMGIRDLVFRNWLRDHDDDRELYERTKRELAAKTWKYMQNYADAKTAVIDDIRSRCGDAGVCEPEPCKRSTG